MSWLLILLIFLSGTVCFLLVKMKKIWGRAYNNFLQHPSLINLRRDYNYALIGGGKAYGMGYNLREGLNWGLPGLNINEVEDILLRYYSLVKENGIIYFILAKDDLYEFSTGKRRHPFVCSILHPWTLSTGQRYVYGKKMIMANPLWMVRLYLYSSKIKRNKVDFGYVLDSSVIDSLKRMANFLNSRNRELVVLLQDEGISPMREQIESIGIKSETISNQIQ